MKFESSILTSKNSRIRLNNDYSEPISTRDSRQICNNDFSFRDFCILSIHRLFQTNISSINVVIDIGKKNLTRVSFQFHQIESSGNTMSEDSTSINNGKLIFFVISSTRIRRKIAFFQNND